MTGIGREIDDGPWITGGYLSVAIVMGTSTAGWVIVLSKSQWTVYLYLILRRDECQARAESSGAVHWHGVMVSTGKATALGCAGPF